MYRQLPLVALAFFMAIATCGCGSSTLPTAPSAPAAAVPPAPVPPAGPPPTYTISGVAFEMTATGRVPVEGVQLYCDSCGSPQGHTFTSSDAQGRYSFAWSMNGVHPLQVWKDGYALARPSGTYGNRTEYINATVNGDTQFDIEVVRR